MPTRRLLITLGLALSLLTTCAQGEDESAKGAGEILPPATAAPLPSPSTAQTGTTVGSGPGTTRRAPTSRPTGTTSNPRETPRQQLERGMPDASTLSGGPWTTEESQYTADRSLAGMLGIEGNGDGCGEIRAAHADATDLGAQYPSIQQRFGRVPFVTIDLTLTPDERTAAAWVAIAADPLFGGCVASGLDADVSTAESSGDDIADPSAHFHAELSLDGKAATLDIWVVQMGRALMTVSLGNYPGDARELVRSAVVAAELYR